MRRPGKNPSRKNPSKPAEGSPATDSNGDYLDPAQTLPLIQDARNGDEQAVRRLLILYHPRLRARLVRQMDPVMRSKVEPEDILQQVYLEAFRAIGQFDYQGKDSFLRWMFTILDRKLIDEHRALRAERRDVRREVSAGPAAGRQASYVDLMARVMTQGSSPSQVVRKNEAVVALSLCVSSLPEHYREVIRMRFMEGRPVADVAEVLGRSIGSIHMICHRALRQLREQVEKRGISHE